MILKIVIAVIVAEAIVEISVASFVFEKLRAMVTSRSEFFGKFVTCGYCQSVWAGVGFAYLFQIKGAWPAFGWYEPIVWGFVIHRASNLWHEAIQRWLHRVPFSVFFRLWSSKEDVEK